MQRTFLLPLCQLYQCSSQVYCGGTLTPIYLRVQQNIYVSDNISDGKDDMILDDESESDATILQQLIDNKEEAPFNCWNKVDEQMLTLTSAAVALSLNNSWVA